MGWGWGARAFCASRKISLHYSLAVVLAACALAGCNTNQTASVSDKRGASVAFESIDGPPHELFTKLVRDLNSEAQSRRLAVLSREDAPAYRVRGYLGAHIKGNQSTVSWLWDVYDREHQRVLRVSGEEKVPGKSTNPWTALDDAAVQRIARNSIEQLGAFLTSNAALPSAQPAFADQSSPEAAGIVRISQPEAPEPTEDDVPLPRKRARTAASTLTLAARQQH